MALDQQPTQLWKPQSSSESSSFECNICLDAAREPVVTLCGHLYCWACIYKWMHVQATADDRSQCPICKAEIHHSDVIPLYGRGVSESESGRIARGRLIPPRPGGGSGVYGRHHFQQYRGFEGNERATLGVGMFGETVYARVFGNSYPYAYTYQYGWDSRMRRQEMLADKSLSRIFIFLFCCVLLCLVVF